MSDPHSVSSPPPAEEEAFLQEATSLTLAHHALQEGTFTPHPSWGMKALHHLQTREGRVEVLAVLFMAFAVLLMGATATTMVTAPIYFIFQKEVAQWFPPSFPLIAWGMVSSAGAIALLSCYVEKGPIAYGREVLQEGRSRREKKALAQKVFSQGAPVDALLRLAVHDPTTRKEAEEAYLSWRGERLRVLGETLESSRRQEASVARAKVTAVMNPPLVLAHGQGSPQDGPSRGELS